jgi:exodeoxyribonuclease VII large subunit
MQVIKRGYTLTTVNGKIITHVAGLKSGEEMVTRFADGSAKSTIISTDKSIGSDLK